MLTRPPTTTALGSSDKAARELVELAADAFDLRKLVQDPCPLANRYHALEELYELYCENDIEICNSLEDLLAQYGLLETNLLVAAKLEPYCGTGSDKDNEEGSASWFDAAKRVKSGTVIFRALITTPELHKGVEDVVYLLVHLSLKAKNEAFVEGLAGLLDRHAGGKRGLEAAVYEKEAVIHANAPKLHLADALVADASNRMFTRGGIKRPWHHTHTAESFKKHKGTLKNADESAVMKRLKRALARLSFTATAADSMG